MNAISTHVSTSSPSMATVKEFGLAIAKSQMFGCENESQGIVFAMACLARGRDPLSIPEEYNLMHGRLSLRADAMLGRLTKAGGDYEIIEHTSEAAEIAIEFKGRKFRERLTFEEAKLEPFVYAGKPKDFMPLLLAGKFDKLTLTSNYATPRRRMQHLWARVVSDAVRVVAPELVTGSYTPEEVADFRGVNDGGVCAGSGRPAAVTTQVVSPLVSTQPTVVNSSTMIDVEQIRRIRDLFDALNLPAESRFKALQKRGAEEIDQLEEVAAAELIFALQEKVKAKDLSNLQEQPEQKVSLNDPISPTMVERIRTLLREVAQQPGNAGVADKVREKLGGKKLADLTIEQGEKLFQALSVRNIEAFFIEQMSQV